MSTVISLQSRPFSHLTLEEKLEVKRLGPDRPQLLTKSGLSSRRFTKNLVLKAIGLLAESLLLSMSAFWRCSTR